jgi:ATP-dependent RNA helicase HelY
MTGRAGRRGKDNVGFVILAPSQFQNPKKIAELLKSPPDALQSQFRATYTSLLNLLDAYKSLSQVREIAEKSFAFRNTAKTVASIEKEAFVRKNRILERLEGSGLTIENAIGFERLTCVKQRLQESSQLNYADLRHGWLKQNAVVGRIVSQGRSGSRFFMILQVSGDTIIAMRDDGEGKNFDIHRINAIYERIYELRDNSIAQAFDDVFDDHNPQIKEPTGKQKAGLNTQSLEIIDNAINSLVPPKFSEDKKRLALQLLWENWSDAEFVQKTERDSATLRNEIWLPFEDRTKVLNHFEYLDLETETVTESGKWLADLRVDRPLLVGETIKSGMFSHLEVKQAVALMASLASDPDRSFGELRLSEESDSTLSKFERIAYLVERIELKNGVTPAPEINFSAAATAEFWSNENVTWSELVTKTRAEEGDLIRLLSRTGEALMQIAHLKKSQPEAAEVAKRAADIVLREPIR